MFKQLVGFLTFTVVFWIDVFTRKEYKHIIVNSLNYCIKEKGLTVNAWSPAFNCTSKTRF